MSKWFNPTAGFDAQSPGDYDYDTNAKKIKAQRELAAALQQQMHGGQMVSGWYVGPGKKDMYSNILQNVAGAFIGADANKSDEANRKDSQASYEAGRNLLMKDQGEYIDDAQQNAYAYTHKRPQDVGPQQEPVAPPPEVAQSFPVRPQPDIQSRPLEQAVAAQGAGAGRGVVNPPFVSGGGGEFRGRGASGSWGEPVTQPRRGGTRGEVNRTGIYTAGVTQPVPPVAAPTVAPAAVQPAILPPPQMGAVEAPPAQVQAQPAAPAAEDGSTFNVNVDAQQRYLQRAVQADRLKAMSMLERSGERGQGLARAVEAQMLGPKKDEYTTLKDGESLYRNGKLIMQGGGDTLEERKFKYQQEQDAKKNGEKAAEVTGGAAPMQTFKSEIQRILESKVPEDAAGFAGTIGAGINAVTGGVIKTDGAGARAEIDGLKAKAKQAAISSLSARGIPASQLANSNVEAESLVASVFNVDYSRMTPTQIRESMSRTTEELDRGLDAIAIKYGGQPQATRPSTINGVPAYQRGQTIRPQ